MSKYDALVEVSTKISALDNDVKLKILALLIEEGAKSITDISHDLTINFSTAHKYLEQLEAAGLVASKQVSENRLKRLFTIRDFDIDLSPKGISEMLSHKEAKGAKKGLMVLDQNSELEEFDEKLFAQKYLKRGMPQGTIVAAINAVLEHAYNGITLLELRRLFKQELENKVKNVNEVFKQIEESDKHKRTYTHLLEVLHPEALDMHAKGDVFIKNLREPKLLNFVHDVRGITIHGATGKRPKTLKELFDQTEFAFEKISGLSLGAHVFDSLNFFVAPLAENEPYLVPIKNFLINLNKKTRKVFIGLEIGTPRFMRHILPDYIVEGAKTIDYNKYTELATKIGKDMLNIIRTEKLTNVHPVLKIWEKENLKTLGNLSGAYVANMVPEWQSLNAAYAGEEARFDAEWKGWNRTVRLGEIQTIAINLPRLALKSKSEQEFFTALKQMMTSCGDFISNMAELAMGEFLRKHETQFKSAHTQRIKWDYIHVEDCVYSISLVGLNEAVQILTGKTLDENLALGKKIISFCDNMTKGNHMPFRIQFKEETDSNIINRFYNLDSKLFNFKIKSYHAGTGIGDSKTHIKLHQFLLGGHCASVSQNELAELKDFGLVRIK